MIWANLDNTNILPVMGVAVAPELSIVSKWMDHGNILDFTKNNQFNPLRLVRSIFVSPSNFDTEIPPKLQEAAMGLEYLHSMDIIHSNLKPVRVTSSFDRFFLTTYADKYPHRW